ncbi:MAG: PNGase F N-terminal domain-containing protein [Bacteroidales bacterium]|jgi:hypothetical protein|nr:PNGase F N-terminal domain-containing protein [Bacteroidales bacterium]
MKKYLLLFLITVIVNSSGALAQKPVRVTYKTIVNGREMPGATRNFIESDGVAVKLSATPRDPDRKEMPAPVQSSYIDLAGRRYIRLADMPDGTRISTVMSFTDMPVAELTGEKEIIAGYECMKTRLTWFSNTIEIWYTEDAGVAGTPVPAYSVPEGLVLRVVRNGNNVTEAEKVEQFRKGDLKISLPADPGTVVDVMAFEHYMREAFVTTITVFDNEVINWEGEVSNPSFGQADVLYRFAGGTVILKKVMLPQVHDLYTLFAEVTQYSAGDAYDRTGTVFVIPQGDPLTFLDGLTGGHTELPLYTDRHGKEYRGVAATEVYQPPVELVRFFTPFGVRHFNDRRTVPGLTWQDSAFYRQDITHYLPLLCGEVWIGAFIGNYDRGGHRLSLRIKYYPETRELEPESSGERWISSLFNTLPIMEMAGQQYGTMFDGDTLSVCVEIPEGVKDLYMVYITTGHGGWGGGDEFNQKLNELFVDGRKVWSYIPWRSDCGTYRLFNPSSGNFWNGLSSSDYSRSGWCPGSLSEPLIIPLNGLTPGTHTISVTVPLGKPAGSSFSHWNISGVLVGSF